MSREHFHEQLERVELRLLSMGELASAAVQRSVEALVRHDDRGRRGGDRRRRRRSTSSTSASTAACLEMLALQSPVATQLRLVSAILHSCLHLERIGDQAVNIAKLYPRDAGPAAQPDPAPAARRDGRARGHDDPHRHGGVPHARPGALL